MRSAMHTGALEHGPTKPYWGLFATTIAALPSKVYLMAISAQIIDPATIFPANLNSLRQLAQSDKAMILMPNRRQYPASAYKTLARKRLQLGNKSKKY
jgi:hypothetical protein